MGLFETIADRRIVEARKAGLFDNLPGAGKPIADLHLERPAGWWASRLVRAERDQLRFDQIQADLKAAMPGLWRLPDEVSVERRVEELNADIVAHNVVCPRHPVAALDPVDVIGRWRRVRAGRR